MKTVLLAVAFDVFSVLSQLPPVVIIFLVVFCLFLATLVLLSESACARLIRILKALRESDNAPRRKRR